MTDEQFQARLAELQSQIDALPADKRGPLIDLLAETRERHFQIKDSFARTRQGIDDWRLALKYMAFDLEATRRERDNLRGQLGDA